MQIGYVGCYFALIATLQTIYSVVSYRYVVNLRKAQEQKTMIKQAEYLREDIVLLAIRNMSGNLRMAAAELGLSRGQLVDYIAKRPEFLKEITELRRSMREILKDEAEDILTEKMREDPALLMFFLKTQARDRGYDLATPAPQVNNVQIKVDAKFLIAAMRKASAEEQIESSDNLIFPAELMGKTT